MSRVTAGPALYGFCRPYPLRGILLMTDLKWSGTIWEIVNGKAAGANYSSQCVTVTPEGFLKVEVKQINGIWTSAELREKTPTGYGIRQWLLQGIHDLDPNVCLGLFAYAWQGNQEYDIEQCGGYFGKATPWGFAAQPSKAGSTKDDVQFSTPMPNDNDVLCTLIWVPTGGNFKMQDSSGKIIKQWTTSKEVDATNPAIVASYIQFYTVPTDTTWKDFKKPAKAESYVIKAFSFTPIGQMPPDLMIPPVVVVPPVDAPPELTLMFNGKRFRIALIEEVDL